jgi:hypothetical protein
LFTLLYRDGILLPMKVAALAVVKTVIFTRVISKLILLLPNL